MISLGGPAPPQVDPAEEASKANQAVAGNFIMFAMLIGFIRVSPIVLEHIGIE